MVMMIASPTTTSAAATTITKNAAIWPSRLPLAREKVTSARLLALSISSTHMHTTIALRRVSTPTQPRVNRIADRRRNGPVGTSVVPFSQGSHVVRELGGGLDRAARR